MHQSPSFFRRRIEVDLVFDPEKSSFPLAQSKKVRELEIFEKNADIIDNVFKSTENIICFSTGFNLITLFSIDYFRLGDCFSMTVHVIFFRELLFYPSKIIDSYADDSLKI